MTQLGAGPQDAAAGAHSTHCHFVTGRQQVSFTPMSPLLAQGLVEGRCHCVCLCQRNGLLFSNEQLAALGLQVMVREHLGTCPPNTPSQGSWSWQGRVELEAPAGPHGQGAGSGWRWGALMVLTQQRRHSGLRLLCVINCMASGKSFSLCRSSSE